MDLKYRIIPHIYRASASWIDIEETGTFDFQRMVSDDTTNLIWVYDAHNNKLRRYEIGEAVVISGSTLNDKEDMIYENTGVGDPPIQVFASELAAGADIDLWAYYNLDGNLTGSTTETQLPRIVSNNGTNTIGVRNDSATTHIIVELEYEYTTLPPLTVINSDISVDVSSYSGTDDITTTANHIYLLVRRSGALWITRFNTDGTFDNTFSIDTPGFLSDDGYFPVEGSPGELARIAMSPTGHLFYAIDDPTLGPRVFLYSVIDNPASPGDDTLQIEAIWNGDDGDKDIYVGGVYDSTVSAKTFTNIRDFVFKGTDKAYFLFDKGIKEFTY